MKRLVLCGMVVAAFTWAAPAQACIECVESYRWPWLQDCFFCTDANCGAELCHIEEYAPGQETCVLQGDGCNNGGRGCPDVQYSALPGTTGATPLEPTWRVVKVTVKPARGGHART